VTIYTVALIAYSHKFAQSLALWSSETPGLSEITLCWKLCKHAICNMVREGALEGGSSVSGSDMLNCFFVFWLGLLCHLLWSRSSLILKTGGCLLQEN
jgi:hypothetical protein